MSYYPPKHSTFSIPLRPNGPRLRCTTNAEYFAPPNQGTILELSGEAEWTVFVSSHDIDEVERLADWVGILDGGSLRLAESTADLQARFRRVECIVSDAPRPPVAQESWLGLETAGHIVRYVESRYEPVRSEAELRLILPEATQITVSPMSLRDIFLALARTYRLGRNL
jgi:ABC-2 type transport system ATP-binding protein